MGRDAAAVAHDVGLLAFVPAGAALVSMPVAVAVGDHHALVPLAVAAVGCAGGGAVLVHRYRDARALHTWPAVEVVALGWLLTALVAAGVLAGMAHTDPGSATADTYRAPVDALFEGVSAITSTGLTVADGHESQLSRIAQWWRSLLQWIGGVGVVLFAAGFGHTASRTSELYGAEAHSDELGGGVRRSVRAITAMYLALTSLAVVAFLLTERSPWIALNHGLAGVATGGFTVTDDSFAGAGTAAKVVAMVVIVAGSTSFVAHHLLFVRRDLSTLRSFTPLRSQLAWFGAGVAALLTAAIVRPDLAPLDATFQWLTAAGTAGFTVVEDLSAWPSLLLWPLIVAMVVGAPSGSTGGGMKLDRITWLTKAVRDPRRSHRRLRWDGKPVENDEAHRSIRHAAQMLGLWVLTLLIGTAAMVLVTDAPLRDVAFDTASALSNVGLDAGVAGGDLSTRGKLILTLLMYVGRLELFAALTLAAQRERTDRG